MCLYEANFIRYIVLCSTLFLITQDFLAESDYVQINRPGNRFYRLKHLH